MTDDAARDLRPTPSSVAAGWYPDPAGRYELRYHNGGAWTADVASDGERFVEGPSQWTDQPPFGHGQRRGPNRFGVAALVCGACAIVTAWMPYVFVIGLILGVLAITFGGIGLRRARRDDLPAASSIAGLVTGFVSLPLAVLGVVLTGEVSDAIDAYENPEPSEVEITGCSTDDASSDWTASGTITNVGVTASDYAIEVSFVRADTDNVQRTARVDVEDLGAGSTATFEVTRPVDLDDVDCVITDVTGPLPFGIDFSGN